MTASTVDVPLVDPSTGEPLVRGGSATTFSLALPDGAACPADSATGGFRVNSFMVPAHTDLAQVGFGAFGPREGFPLFDKGRPYVNANTAMHTGLVVGLPPFDLATLVRVPLAEGVYRVGVACTAGGVMRASWSSEIAISMSGTPSALSWSSVTGAPTVTSIAPLTTSQALVVDGASSTPTQPSVATSMVTLGARLGVQPVVADVASVAIPVVPTASGAPSGGALAGVALTLAAVVVALGGWRFTARRRSS